MEPNTLNDFATFLRENPVPIMIGLDLLALGFTSWVLKRGGASIRVIQSAVGALVVWLAVLHGVIATQSLVPADISGVGFLAIIFAGVGLFGAGIFATPVGRALMNLRQEDLMLAQGIRVFFGAGFLLQAAIGLLPQTFGIIDGFTHVTAGFLGLVAAVVATRNPSDQRTVLFANAFGLIDILVVASSIALILLPVMTPFHPMMYAVFLPAPIWLWLHVVSLSKLWIARQNDAVSVAAE